MAGAEQAVELAAGDVDLPGKLVDGPVGSHPVAHQGDGVIDLAPAGTGSFP
ncbi:hypothetical protein D9M73_258370 [compost metagenome]